jgi:uncharacterized protein YdaU (DUF1376 family)
LQLGWGLTGVRSTQPECSLNTGQELESSADARAREIAADADKRVNAVKKSTAAFKELYEEELDGLRMEMAAERASIQKEMEAVKNAEKGRSWFS